MSPVTIQLGSVLPADRRDSLPARATSRAASSRLGWWCLLHIIIGGQVLEEVALLLHDAVELVHVDLTIAITVGLVDHVLELLVIDVLTKLLSNTGKVAEGDLVGVSSSKSLNTFSMSSRVSFSPILAV